MKVIAAVTAVLVLIGVIVWAVLRDPAAAPPQARTGSLRVCADPNNMPFSNRAGKGFENQIAELIAGKLHSRLEYVWWPQRRGFVRNTLKAHECDLIIGIPTANDMVLTTVPYYRSSYVFVYRSDRGIHVTSFDAPELRHLRIGVHLVGDDYANTPPAHALTRRHIITNVAGYRVTEDYSQPNPPERLMEAVDRGDIDVAIAWGPLAGWYAKTHPGFSIVPVSPSIDLPYLPFVFDIAMGVRRGEDGFKRQLDQLIEDSQTEIQRILDRFGIPNLTVSK